MVNGDFTPIFAWWYLYCHMPEGWSLKQTHPQMGQTPVKSLACKWTSQLPRYAWLMTKNDL